MLALARCNFYSTCATITTNPRIGQDIYWRIHSWRHWFIVVISLLIALQHGCFCAPIHGQRRMTMGWRSSVGGGARCNSRAPNGHSTVDNIRKPRPRRTHDLLAHPFHLLVHIPLTTCIWAASGVSSQPVLAFTATIVPSLCVILFFHALPTTFTPHWSIPTPKSNPSAENSRTWHWMSCHSGCQPPPPSPPTPPFFPLLLVAQHNKLMKTSFK